VLVRFVPAPSFTDAYYHFNAASRLASGQGLTDAYLWNYIGAPDRLPAPSHLYWMPLTSVAAALGMAIFNDPNSHSAAQALFVPMLAAVGCAGFWLGRQLGGSAVRGWYAGLLTLFGGYFVRFWGAMDTFTPYAFAGSLCMVTLALAVTREKLGWWAAAGAFAALGHLTRADGLLLVIVGICLALWPWEVVSAVQRFRRIVILVTAYLLIMSPWYVRNLHAIGSPLPIGGAQAAWFRSYDELFSYPPIASPDRLFADGLEVFINSRWDALIQNLQTFFFVEGWVVLMPFALVGLWHYRRDRRLRPFWVYAAGLHAAMTLAFPFPGYRGGLFHSAAALVPWWAALIIVGVHQATAWAAQRRSRWNVRTAQSVFSVGILVLAIALSLVAASWAQVRPSSEQLLYAELSERLPVGSRVMANDPAAVYYHTGLGGVVLPNEPPEVILEIARTYTVGYLLIQFETLEDGTRVAAIPAPLDPLLNTTPAFLRPMTLSYPNARLYAIDFNPG
jgi:4-amino-4-deoxy-L-arabinose transferase-like glycosyltransferase